MNNYRERYNKIVSELKEITNKLNDLSDIVDEKKAECKDMATLLSSLQFELDSEKNILNEMINLQQIKIYNVSSLINITIAVILTILCVVILKSTAGIINTKRVIDALYMCGWLTVPVGLAVFTKIFSRRLVEKRYMNKLTNSEKYQKLLEEISVKEKEMEKAEVKKDDAIKEYNFATGELYKQMRLKKLKKAELENLRSEIVDGLINLPVVTRVQSSCCKRVKTPSKDSNNN